MPGIKTILIATDFSEGAAKAEHRAAMLARQHAPATLELLNVKEATQSDVLAQILNSTVETAIKTIAARTEQALQNRAALLEDNYGAECTYAVRFGMLASEVVSRGEEISADLIVAGAHGGNFFSKLLLGNTADKLAHLCKRPLLMVKNAPKHAYEHVLIPIDFSEDSRHAAKLAMQIAPQASITFLHAYEVWYEGALQYSSIAQEVIDDYRMRESERSRVALNQFIRDINAEDLPVKRVIRFGMPGAVIRNYAQAQRPDLIVMGKHGKSWLESLLLGSVTRDALDQTDSDILIVPSGEA
jgi:nucleotide-binding universal stress UspA family protein